MSRYIDADALKAFIRNKYFQCDMPEEWGNGVMWATSQINRYCNKVAPSIDIVRCKECEHSFINENHPQKPRICGLTKKCGTTKDDWYCADGEREGE